jgi:hypothetical protein
MTAQQVRLGESKESVEGARNSAARQTCEGDRSLEPRAIRLRRMRWFDCGQQVLQRREGTLVARVTEEGDHIVRARDARVVEQSKQDRDCVGAEFGRIVCADAVRVGAVDEIANAPLERRGGGAKREEMDE